MRRISYRLDLAARMGVNEGETLTMAQTRTHEPFQLSAGFQEI